MHTHCHLKVAPFKGYEAPVQARFSSESHTLSVLYRPLVNSYLISGGSKRKIQIQQVSQKFPGVGRITKIKYSLLSNYYNWSISQDNKYELSENNIAIHFCAILFKIYIIIIFIL